MRRATGDSKAGALVLALDGVTGLLRTYGFTDLAQEYEARARELSAGCTPSRWSQLFKELRSSVSGMGGLVDRELRTARRAFGEPARLYDAARDRLTASEVADNARLRKFADEILELTRLAG